MFTFYQVYKYYDFLTLCMLGNFSCFCCRLLTYYKIDFLKKILQGHYKSVKQFGSRSGPTFCLSWSGSKLFAKVFSRPQKSLLARKELQKDNSFKMFSAAKSFVHEMAISLTPPSAAPQKYNSVFPSSYDWTVTINRLNLKLKLFKCLQKCIQQEMSQTRDECPQRNWSSTRHIWGKIAIIKQEKPRNEARSQCQGQNDSKLNAPLRHPKRNHHPKFGIPTSNNIGDMLWTQ